MERSTIVPRTSLKVMSSISNVVRALQRKVSILENDCIQIFKYMLAGDNVSASALSTETHSPKFKMIKIWYKKGFWTEDMVQDAVDKGAITQEEFNEIVNK